MIRFRPFPVVLAAPSGAGKTSLARALVERWPDMVFSLSATTRPPRPGEVNGRDYEFVDDAGFDGLVADGQLLEFAEVHGRRYGTLRRGVDAALGRGHTVVLDIDVQGAQAVRQVLPDAVLVFVLPPSVAEMRRRLTERGSGEDAGELATRLRTARKELEAVASFDYVIENDEFELAIRRLEAVIAAERARAGRLDGLDVTLAALRADMDQILETGEV
ncbi:MAG TPA: guanylate kinase [Longimicrobiales bacterium]|nr:guanylate kinase [Longimicrobiales bacterium]